MKAPSFNFYAQDFLTGCTYLTNEEIGIYVKMLCKQWTDGNIPKKRLGFLIGKDWDNISDELKSKFKDDGEFLVNERLEKEREKKQNFIEKQSENGRKGGRPRKNESSESVINTGIKNELKPNALKNKNPNKTQKKPLEKRNMNTEYEKESVIEKEGMGEKTNLVYPFNSEDFIYSWMAWKEYKKTEFRFKYKSIQSEQASLSELNNLSGHDKEKAIAIIHQSMAQGWKGFFELKSSSNGKSNTNGKSDYSEDFQRKIADRLQS